MFENIQEAKLLQPITAFDEGWNLFYFTLNNVLNSEQFCKSCEKNGRMAECMTNPYTVRQRKCSVTTMKICPF